MQQNEKKIIILQPQMIESILYAFYQGNSINSINY
jgi:hypothetical protein